MAFGTVVIFGAGIMGYSLALVHARVAREVRLVDTRREALDKANLLMEQSLRSLRAAGGEAPEGILEKIQFRDDGLAALSGAQLVVEAISESAQLKERFFSELLRPTRNNPGLDPGALVASNTSWLDPFALAPEALKPRLYAAHHFLPPHLLPLAEIAAGPGADSECTKALLAHYREAGCIPVLLQKFVQGFIINRLQAAMQEELYQLLRDGVAAAEDIDLAVKSSLAPRMCVLGVVKRLDFVNLELVLGNLQRNGKQAPPILAQLVAQGHKGVQSGRGFYSYEDVSEEHTYAERDEKILQILRLMRELGELP